MSAATDEAEDGPLEWNNGDNRNQGEKSQDDENEQTQEEELLTPKLSKPTGFAKEEDSSVSNNDVESEDFGPLQTSSPVPERPSSADDSLSIPDDSPSLQVRPMCAQGRPNSDRPRVLSDLPLQAQGSVYPTMVEVPRLLYGHLISDSKLACLLLQ